MPQTLQLNGHEARLLGVLFEKERTTPDQYPLSLHALTAGANQKSNREPMTDWSEAEVFVGVTGLMQKGLAGKVFPSGSRVEKFRHNAREALGLDDRRLALLAELLMRGPQTVGELRTRAGRMSELGAIDAVAADLSGMALNGLVRRVEPGPGSRAERWAQLLCANLHPVDPVSEASPVESRATSPTPRLEDRVAKLEARVEVLERALEGRAGV
jgi:uncharacterized protein YceH (UPF0502 family)